MYQFHYFKILVISAILTYGFNNALGSQILSWDQTEITRTLGPETTEASASFFVYNSGDDLIIIDRAESNSFACKTILKDKVIYPQSRAQIDVRFDADKKVGKDDMPSHIKMALTRTNETIPFSNGQLLLGTWQGIFLWEHRSVSHSRELVVTIYGD